MREALIALLTAVLLMAAVVERVDGALQARIEFNAPPVVRDFIEDPTFVTGYFGPFGCAKTTAGAIKAWCYGQMYPGARGVVIRATYPELRDTTMKTFFEWFPPGVAGRWEATPKTFWMHTGEGRKPQEVLFRAMDQVDDIADVLSLDIAWAWIDEPQGGLSLKDAGRGTRTIVREPGIAHELFKALLGRLGRQRGYPKMAWLTGNPPPPSHWIAEEFAYDPGESGCDPPTNRKEDRRLYLGDQNTNRHNLPPRYYEDLERDYGADTPMARRFLKGQWIDFLTEKPFKARDIQTWETLPPLPLVVEGAVDPAISKDDAASTTAIVVAGQARRGEMAGTIFELFHDEGHWGVLETSHQMLKATRAWKVRTWRIETVAYQKALAETLDREARLAGVVINIDLVPPDADKIRRANAWAPKVEDGTILFRSRESKLVRAMLAVPQDRAAWDLVDAGGHCFRGFPEVPAPKQTLPGHELSTPAMATSYAVTPAEKARVPVAPDRRPRVAASAPQDLKRATGYAVRRPTIAPRRRG